MSNNPFSVAAKASQLKDSDEFPIEARLDNRNRREKNRIGANNKTRISAEKPFRSINSGKSTFGSEDCGVDTKLHFLTGFGGFVELNYMEEIREGPIR